RGDRRTAPEQVQPGQRRLSASLPIVSRVAPRGRRLVATMAAFVAVGPLLGALLYLSTYVLPKSVVLRASDAPTWRVPLDYAPDMYVFGALPALTAGLAVALRQWSRGEASPTFLAATGIVVGLANAIILRWIGPDLGGPEVPVAVWGACHAVA